ncbi:transglycosylase domain-containing protein [Tropicimonas sp. IMCC6043]|uniref:transglycosylase domain-containing protein n=1 Tax=Tropicimonas sp. IMCC6043 TaxID=2510645 RepID=UPI00101D863F|nr:transglycosylase domain-containing protein [Tropicimonas sp. IMCC6043]RYH09904.1 penicillin-binding protein [Tropicimonas sp. IMCC6043]
MSSKGGKRPTLRADKRYSSGAGGRSPTSKTPKKAAAKPAAKRKTPSKKRARTARKSGPLGWLAALFRFVLRLIWSVVWRSGVVFALILAGAVLYFYAQLPPFAEQIDGRIRGSVTLLDRNGEVFAWRGEQFEQVTDIDQVSPYLKDAVVASEDRRFYWHLGVSPRGVASAIRINLSEGRSALSGHGGSTLTQQTAKLLCLGVPFDAETWKTEAEYEDDCRRTTMRRKIKEAIYAMAMELKYSKDEILVIYLNRAYLGASARGFEAAAQRYFGIPARQLSVAQAAMLAGLLPAPTRFAPTNNLKRSQDRADTVVRLMYDQGYITESERDAAWAQPATLSEAAQSQTGGYFADWVMDSGPSFLTRDTTEDVILKTTLDQEIQRSAEEALQIIFQEKVAEGSEAQAAIVVMSADGAVRAMVGGRETRVSGAFNRATMAKRQTGSSFKPFVYAAAMDLGYSPLDTVVDEPWCIDMPAGQPRYCPKNYSREYKGRVTLTQALASSLNIPAVKVSEFVGRDNVRKIASDFGIDNKLATGPSLALGVSESTLLEMSGAYAGILNGGRSVTPYGLVELRLEGDPDPLMGQGGGFGERVISDSAARNLVYMMSRVIEAGTGQRAKLGERPAAGKTGTTQAARDAWFIGFTADYVTGVWMGYDDNTPLQGVTGGGLPAEIWHEAMVRIHEGKPILPLPMDTPRPAAAAQSAPRYDGASSSAQSAAQPARQQPRRDNLAERILKDVGALFGGRN